MALSARVGMRSFVSAFLIAFSISVSATVAPTPARADPLPAMSGWCTATWPVSAGPACYSSAVQACIRQHADYGGAAPFWGISSPPGGEPFTMICRWPTLDPNGIPYYNTGPASVFFTCDGAYVRVPPGQCKPEG